MTSGERMARRHEGRASRPGPGDPLRCPATRRSCAASRSPGCATTPRRASAASCSARRCTGYDGGPLYAYASAGGWEFGGDIEFPVKKYSGAIVVTRTPIQNEDDVYALKVPEDVSKAGALPIALGIARKQAEYGMPVTLQIGAPLHLGRLGHRRRAHDELAHQEARTGPHRAGQGDRVPDQGGRVLRQGVRGGEAHGLPRRRHRDQQAHLPQAVRDLLAPLPAEDQQPGDRVGHRHLLHPHLRRAEQEPQVLAAGAHDQADGDERRAARST